MAYIDQINFDSDQALLSGNKISSITDTVAIITTTSSIVLATDTNRKYARFQNDSDTTIYLAHGTTATVNKGIRLNANGGEYEINLNNRYTGAISAVSSATNKKLLISYS